MYDVRHFSKEEFATAAAAYLGDMIVQTLKANDTCILGLSGGSTPGPVYADLGKREDVNWSKVRIFLIDERYVPADTLESNTRLIKDTLLRSAAIPPKNFVAPDTSQSLESCVRDFDAGLREMMRLAPADIVILGLGEDGHTASLFPGDPAIDEQEKFAVHTTTDRFPVHDRITVTVPVLAAAKHRVVLLNGKKKLDVLREMEQSNDGAHRWPLKAVGDAIVFIQD